MLALARAIGPLAIVVALIGALIGYLLSLDNQLGAWLLAAFLLGHGWVHIAYVMPGPARQAVPSGGFAYPFRLEHSWLLGDRGSLRAIGIVLVAITIVAYALAALATVALIIPATAWAALVLAGTIASAVLLGVFFGPTLILGLGIDLVLLVVAVASIWTPAG
jgi:hypothetical protein